jgi:hypothetical protein
MSNAINLTTDTNYTLADFDANQGIKQVRFLAKGVTATFFIKHNDTQGYSTAGFSLVDGVAQITDIDTYDVFKVVFASGTVTAKVLG